MWLFGKGQPKKADWRQRRRKRRALKEVADSPEHYREMMANPTVQKIINTDSSKECAAARKREAALRQKYGGLGPRELLAALPSILPELLGKPGFRAPKDLAGPALDSGIDEIDLIELSLLLEAIFGKELRIEDEEIYTITWQELVARCFR